MVYMGTLNAYFKGQYEVKRSLKKSEGAIKEIWVCLSIEVDSIRKKEGNM